MAPPTDGWHVLIVDDEPDVHQTTRLAVKRKTWRKRPFILADVSSAKDARDLLMNGDYGNRLQVAVVDVVMETRFAGLDLCRFIRAELPRSVRIILRTGQPGVAPEESIINDYDIDFYFAKTEATAERLYMALRSCLRSSQDIETLLAFGNQLRSFTTALQKMTSRADLTRFMRVGLDFLELKHSATIAFHPDIDSGEDAHSPGAKAVLKALELGLAGPKLHAASELGINEPWFVLAFAAVVEGSPRQRGGFVVEVAPLHLHGLQSDLLVFTQNWTAALAGLLAQTRVLRIGELTELSYLDRIGGIATVITGASQRIQSAVASATSATNALKTAGDLAQVRAGVQVLEADLSTTKQVVDSFALVSATQLRDDRGEIDLVTFVRSCVDLVARPNEYEIRISTPSRNLPWTGYPGSLAHVVIKLVEGAVRHAYEDDEGKIDVRLSEGPAGFRIEVEDYGKGLPHDVLKGLEEPVDPAVPMMVGLKFAVARNVVEQRLRGSMKCTSEEGKGTKVVLVVPREVPAG